MYKLSLLTAFVFLSIFSSAQYLVKLEIENFNDEYDCQMVYYVNNLQNINSKYLFSNLRDIITRRSKNEFDSLLLKFGIPLTDPGFPQDTRCNKIDSLTFDLNEFFINSSLVYRIKDRNSIFSLRLEILKFNGEVCIFRPNVQVWGDMPLFPMIGVIVTLNKLDSLTLEEKKLLSN